MLIIDRTFEPVELGPMSGFLEGLEGKEKFDKAIEVVKSLPIDGCITGSCWLPNYDPDLWDSTDIDVFVYSKDDLIKALNIADNILKMTPGTGSEKSEAQERWKLNRLETDGLNIKFGITTYKFNTDGVVVNFTFKSERFHGKWQEVTSAPAVLASFDMSIVLQAYDIKQHILYDLRPSDVPNYRAVPNPMRRQDYMAWTVARWVRQFDRCVKYWERGFDTRPVAEFYVEMIDEVIKAGCLFDSDDSQEYFAGIKEEFEAKRAQICEWLEDKKREDAYLDVL